MAVKFLNNQPYLDLYGFEYIQVLYVLIKLKKLQKLRHKLILKYNK